MTIPSSRHRIAKGHSPCPAWRAGRALRHFLPVFVLVLVFLVQGCATAPYTGRSQFIMVSPQQEAQLGLQEARRIAASEPVVIGTAEARSVAEVGQRIAMVARRPDFRWEFKLINKPVANAFCLPGGKVFVYAGIFEFVASDDELATVMAHEIGHAIARHGAERMSRAMMVQLGHDAAAIALGVSGQSPAMVQAFSQVYGTGANVGLMLPFGREQEYEADRIGLMLMAQAGYDPRASITFWNKMSSGKGGGKRPPEFLSTHPTGSNRMEALNAAMGDAMRLYRASGKGAAEKNDAAKGSSGKGTP